jgi:hypothetical protein
MCNVRKPGRRRAWPWNAEQLAGLLAERLGHQVEADDPEHEPRGEPEDEVLVVAEPQGREPAD